MDWVCGVWSATSCREAAPLIRWEGTGAAGAAALDGCQGQQAGDVRDGESLRPLPPVSAAAKKVPAGQPHPAQPHLLQPRAPRVGAAQVPARAGAEHTVQPQAHVGFLQRLLRAQHVRQGECKQSPTRSHTFKIGHSLTPIRHPTRPQVDLYGFDAYTSKKKSYRYHYFDDVQGFTGVHSFDLAVEVYKLLAERGLVRLVT
jgi:hypothetical protein